jgi:hypothetical protein
MKRKKSKLEEIGRNRRSKDEETEKSKPYREPIVNQHPPSSMSSHSMTEFNLTINFFLTTALDSDIRIIENLIHKQRRKIIISQSKKMKECTFIFVCQKGGIYR